MLAEASIRRIESLPGAGRKIPTHQPVRDISLGADAIGGRCGGRTTYAAAAQRKRATATQRTTGRTASQARRKHAAIQTRPLRFSSADPCRGELRQATGRGKQLHQSWDLGWR
jgi:hypothetical protein